MKKVAHTNNYVNTTKTQKNIRKVIYESESHSSTELRINFPKGSSYSISELFPNIEKNIQFKQLYIYI